MKVDQISIFLENKPGGLERVTRILKEANINIRTLSIADTSEFGILRLIVNDVEATVRVLKEDGFRVSRTTVVAVEVPDRPGGLYSIMEVLSAHGINVEYLYGLRREERENAVIIFRFGNPDQAIDVLIKNNLTVLPGAKLYSL